MFILKPLNVFRRGMYMVFSRKLAGFSRQLIQQNGTFIFYYKNTMESVKFILIAPKCVCASFYFILVLITLPGNSTSIAFSSDSFHLMVPFSLL